MLAKLLFTIACLIFPIVWGVFINWLFNFWQARTTRNDQDEPIFPDYQI